MNQGNTDFFFFFQLALTIVCAAVDKANNTTKRNLLLAAKGNLFVKVRSCFCDAVFRLIPVTKID